MNKIYQDGMEIIQNSEYIKVNGKVFPLPDYVKKSNSNTCNIIDGKIEINGYQFSPKTGKFTRKSFLQRLFSF
jgi:hypothetical protein